MSRKLQEDQEAIFTSEPLRAVELSRGDKERRKVLRGCLNKALYKQDITTALYPKGQRTK